MSAELVFDDVERALVRYLLANGPTRSDQALRWATIVAGFTEDEFAAALYSLRHPGDAGRVRVLSGGKRTLPNGDTARVLRVRVELRDQLSVQLDCPIGVGGPARTVRPPRRGTGR